MVRIKLSVLFILVAAVAPIVALPRPFTTEELNHKKQEYLPIKREGPRSYVDEIHADQRRRLDRMLDEAHARRVELQHKDHLEQVKYNKNEAIRHANEVIRHNDEAKRHTTTSNEANHHINEVKRHAKKALHHNEEANRHLRLAQANSASSSTTKPSFSRPQLPSTTRRPNAPSLKSTVLPHPQPNLQTNSASTSTTKPPPETQAQAHSPQAHTDGADHPPVTHTQSQPPQAHTNGAPPPTVKKKVSLIQNAKAIVAQHPFVQKAKATVAQIKGRVQPFVQNVKAKATQRLSGMFTKSKNRATYEDGRD